MTGAGKPPVAPGATRADASAAADQANPRAGNSITISGGLATFPWDGTSVDALLTKADQALLAAKRAGKNRIFSVGDQG
jgi:PleD family two-component response regulator